MLRTSFALSYYNTPQEKAGGKAPLGTLALANASVRRPTDLKSKGRYQSTCMRLDLDPEAQQAVRVRARSAASAKSTKGSGFFGGSTSSKGDDDDDDGDDDDDAGGATAGAKEKYKYLLAAESVQGMSDWINSIDFWSSKNGSQVTRLTKNGSQEPDLLFLELSKQDVVRAMRKCDRHHPSPNHYC